MGNPTPAVKSLAAAAGPAEAPNLGTPAEPRPAASVVLLRRGGKHRDRALEVLLLTPWVDHLTESNATVHFTQHGLIFVGGILMGWALRDLRLTTLINARR